MALAIVWRGVKTEGEMAPEISIENQRPAQYVFDGQVQQRLSEIRANEAREKTREGGNGGLSCGATNSLSPALRRGGLRFCWLAGLYSSRQSARPTPFGLQGAGVASFHSLRKRLVGGTGFEPVTPSMSRMCSPTELTALQETSM